MRNPYRNRRPRDVRPFPEALEDRRLLATLAPLPNLNVPSLQGYELPLDGSGSALDQTFTITRTSGSADIVASIAQGPFWTMNVSYSDPSDSSNNFQGALVFQLFQQLTPNTVGEIQAFMNAGTFTGKEFTRIASGFPGATDDILQGGTTSGANEEAPSGVTGTPFLNENVQPLAFTGTYQLAMANAGINPGLSDYTQGVNTNDDQFFITTGSPDQVLGYGYTIFGQMIAGQDVIAKMLQVPLTTDLNLGTKTQPANPLVMSSLSLSTTNPSGVAIIDTSQAHPGDAATFEVTATDSDGNSVSQSFTVTVGQYETGSELPLSAPPIAFKPLAAAATATVAQGSSTAITATGQAGYPDPNLAGTLSYSIVTPPSHGTVSDFNASTGTFTYTPDPGYSGPDALQYEVQEAGETPYLGTDPSNNQYLFAPATTETSDPATVSIAVAPTPVAPTINWPAPAAITYGTALSSSQLDATAPAGVQGTFVYSPPAGTVLTAGPHTLSATFTPADTALYTTATKTTTIDVAQAEPTIAWPDPASITSGTALSALQLDATADVPGTFTYSPAAGAVLGVGDGQTLSVTFAPADSTDYESRTATTAINVLPPPPLVTVTGIAATTNKKHQVTKVVVTFSGALNPTDADSTATYLLIEQGKHGKFAATPSTTIGIASASYDASTEQVTLIPRKPFALSKPVEVLIEGGPPSGLRDAEGRLIDGNGDGQPGSNAAGVLTKRGASVTALRSAAAADAVDALVAESNADDLVRGRASIRMRPREKGRTR